jgi:D-glycero-beta-D-manno-heptose 1-phosphate adenylyltransferase
MNDKVVTLAGVLSAIAAAREQKKKIVTTNGCFDILHAGHVHYLAAARALGDLLVVGVNSDASVRALKGAGRPVNPEADRATVLAGLSSVDLVFIFNEKDPIGFLSRIKPDVHVKGGDYTGRLPEQDTVEQNGGRVAIVPMVRGVSTTDIVRKIKETPCI